MRILHILMVVLTICSEVGAEENNRAGTGQVQEKAPAKQAARDLSGRGLQVLGTFTSRWGEQEVKDKANKQARDIAKERLKDKPEGSGVIIHKDFYETSHPESPFKVTGSIVHEGGIGNDKKAAIKKDLEPRIYPSSNGGKKTLAQRTYFQKRADGSISEQPVTRKEVEAVRVEINSTSIQAPTAAPKVEPPSVPVSTSPPQPAAAPPPSPAPPKAPSYDPTDKMRREPREPIQIDRWERFERWQRTG